MQKTVEVDCRGCEGLGGWTEEYRVLGRIYPGLTFSCRECSGRGYFTEVVTETIDAKLPEEVRTAAAPCFRWVLCGDTLQHTSAHAYFVGPLQDVRASLHGRLNRAHVAEAQVEP